MPAVSLGLWHNFGTYDDYAKAEGIIVHAFDQGVTHFDLANNYGPEPGSAEENFGKILRTKLSTHRDEMIISTKAGYKMWEGPYGDWGSRKYMLASLDQSLKRMGLEYVDIFYSHRHDRDTPLEETMGALAHAVRVGKALYAGISNYPPDKAREAYQILREMGVPCLIHQERYSMIDRHAENGLTDAVRECGVGLITFSPLGQGLLTDRYLKGIPSDSRMAIGHFLKAERLTPALHKALLALNDMAHERGETLAAMALAWNMRQPAVTSVLVGASSTAQLDANIAALDSRSFTQDELDRIDEILKTAE